jgi:8-oxo-dGTP pyrophosphatase MutT (NUDIX family)
MHNETTAHGTVTYATGGRKTDYLYRVSLKCVIKNQNGQVLVVKETGRTVWDLPGGGMDHGESLQNAIAREMYEEVGMQGDFTYRILAVEEPALLGTHNFWQIRLIYEVTPEVMEFVAGEDGDEIIFIDPQVFEGSEHNAEQKVYEYAKI